MRGGKVKVLLAVILVLLVVHLMTIKSNRSMEKRILKGRVRQLEELQKEMDEKVEYIEDQVENMVIRRDSRGVDLAETDIEVVEYGEYVDGIEVESNGMRFKIEGLVEVTSEEKEILGLEDVEKGIRVDIEIENTGERERVLSQGQIRLIDQYGSAEIENTIKVGEIYGKESLYMCKIQPSEIKRVVIIYKLLGELESVEVVDGVGLATKRAYKIKVTKQN